MNPMNPRFSLAMLSAAILGGKQLPNLRALDENLFSFPKFLNRSHSEGCHFTNKELRNTRSKYMPHTGAKQASRGFRTSQERRLASIKSMLDKGLTPWDVRPGQDTFRLGSMKRRVTLIELFECGFRRPQPDQVLKLGDKMVVIDLKTGQKE
jgi:hypothetical protein